MDFADLTEFCQVIVKNELRLLLLVLVVELGLALRNFFHRRVDYRLDTVETDKSDFVLLELVVFGRLPETLFLEN